MEYVKSLLFLESKMLLMILAGILATKVKIITQEGQKCLTDLVIDIIFPCYIIACFLKNTEMNFTGEFLQITLLSIAMQLLTILLSRVLYRRIAKAQRTILQYATIVSNSGFLGFPLVGSVFGATGMLYASIFLIFQRINNFSVGISYFTYSDKKSIVKKVLLHPCILSTIIGVIIMLLHIQIPELLGETINTIGACSTPLSMILIGVVLSDVRIRSLYDKLIGYYSLIRLVAIPGVVFVLCLIFKISPLVSGVAVLLSGMPAGTLSAMLGSKYGADAVFAGRLIVFTTAVSLATIPLWCILTALI
ncbi:MAG: AEC family transporter [Intestinimonas sp.]|jgi:predicted permease|nr:AEC family transporter [Intestinimonas sp.]